MALHSVTCGFSCLPRKPFTSLCASTCHRPCYRLFINVTSPLFWYEPPTSASEGIPFYLLLQHLTCSCLVRLFFSIHLMSWVFPFFCFCSSWDPCPRYILPPHSITKQIYENMQVLPFIVRCVS